MESLSQQLSFSSLHREPPPENVQRTKSNELQRPAPDHQQRSLVVSTGVDDRSSYASPSSQSHYYYSSHHAPHPNEHGFSGQQPPTLPSASTDSSSLIPSSPRMSTSPSRGPEPGAVAGAQDTTGGLSTLHASLSSWGWQAGVGMERTGSYGGSSHGGWSGGEPWSYGRGQMPGEGAHGTPYYPQQQSYPSHSSSPHPSYAARSTGPGSISSSTSSQASRWYQQQPAQPSYPQQQQHNPYANFRPPQQLYQPHSPYPPPSSNYQPAQMMYPSFVPAPFPRSPSRQTSINSRGSSELFVPPVPFSPSSTAPPTSRTSSPPTSPSTQAAPTVPFPHPPLSPHPPYPNQPQTALPSGQQWVYFPPGYPHPSSHLASPHQSSPVWNPPPASQPYLPYSPASYPPPPTSFSPSPSPIPLSPAWQRPRQPHVSQQPPTLPHPPPLTSLPVRTIGGQRAGLGGGPDTASGGRSGGRQAYHPAAPAHRSDFVMWVGNVPSDATYDELWRFFNAPTPPISPENPTLPPKPIDTPVISSIFLISKSNCCFVNYTSEQALISGISRFNGQPMRPLAAPGSPSNSLSPRQPTFAPANARLNQKLVCRVRQQSDDLKSGVGGQRGRGVHTAYVREKRVQQQQAAAAKALAERSRERERAGQPAGGEGRIMEEKEKETGPKKEGSGASVKTNSTQNSTDSFFLSKYFPVRYFILKSMSTENLELSVQKGVWVTQPHNEPVLDQAFRTSKEVILIFGANKTGEFFGFAKMTSGMNGKTERRVSFANSHTDSIDSRHSSSLGAPSPTTQSFSPTHATYRSAQHQSSAPVIREDDEPSGESPEVEKAKTLPNRIKEVKEQLESAQVPFSNLADSPGEMTPGEEDRIANSPGGLFNPCSLSSPNTATSSEGRKPSLLTKVLDRHGKPAQSSAPSALERRPTSDVPQPSAEHHSTLDPKLLTPLTVTEKTDAIAAIARASGTGSGGGVGSGSSPSEAGREAGGEDAEAGGKPPTENGKTDEDGVNRTDQLSSNPSPSSTTSSSHRATTTNAAKSHTSSYSNSSHPSLRGSSIFSNSSSTATQQPPPNLHLPPTPAEVEGVSPGSIEGSVLPNGLAIVDKDEGGFSWERERAAEGGATSVSDESIGAPFKVEWVRTDPLPFGRVKHLRNGWNANREVKVSRDGTELEPEIGQQLLQAWDAATSSPIAPRTSPSIVTSPSSISTSSFQLTSPPPHQSSRALPAANNSRHLGLGLAPDGLSTGLPRRP